MLRSCGPYLLLHSWMRLHGCLCGQLSSRGGGGSFLRRRMKNEWNHPQTLRGSFSAVWTATIATKYSFCSIFRDLQDSHTFAPLRSQNFSEKPSKLLPEWKWNFIFIRVFRWILRFFCENLMKICRNFAEMFGKWQTVPRFCEKKTRQIWKNATNFRNWWEISFFISFFHSSL